MDNFESERAPLNNNDFEEAISESLMQRLMNTRALTSPTHSTSRLVSILTTICCKSIRLLDKKFKPILFV